ncbi:MAG: hypothetical protein R2939_11720 [Kofleriaceae bacterium]
MITAVIALPHVELPSLLSASSARADARPLVPTPRPPLGADQRAILLSDEGVAIEVVVARELRADAPTELALTLWGADGAPLDVDEIVVTFEGPSGGARGFAARKDGVGRYLVSYAFPADGTYVVRVFPPVGDVAFAAELQIGPAAPSS